MGVSVFALAMANIGYALGRHLSENTWENMVEAGKAEFSSGSGNPHFVVWVITGLSLFLFAIMIHGMACENTEETKTQTRNLGVD